MVLCSYLTFKTEHDPSDIQSQVFDSMEARVGLPIAWTALFKLHQLDAKNFVLVSTTEEAKQTIDERSHNLNLALGQQWRNGIDQFLARLSKATHVELDLEEWFDEPTEFEAYIKSYLSVFEEPFYTGKRHLISRKLKVSESWRRHVIDIYPTTGIFEPVNNVD